MNARLRQTETMLEVAGSSMRVLDTGEGHVVVLGHSYLWDAEMWRPQIDVLARDYRVIVPELWGHGGSGPMPAGTTTLRDIARHHLEAMDKLGIDRFSMVGLSFGGMWGAELALLAPERVNALVLMDTSLAAEPEVSRRRYFGLLDIMEAVGEVPDAVLDTVVPLYFSPDIAARQPELPRRFHEQLRQYDRARLTDSVVPLGRMIFGRQDMLDELPRLRIPRLVMTGREDIPRPPWEGRQMAGIMGCPFIEIQDAGHIASLEAPELVSSYLQAFLNGATSTLAGSGAEPGCVALALRRAGQPHQVRLEDGTSEAGAAAR